MKQNLPWLLLILAGIVMAIVIFVLRGPRERENLLICERNLRQIGEALHAYFADREGGRFTFPPRLNDLVPRYLPEIPVCPSNGKTYKYQRYADNAVAADCVVYCPGAHAGLPAEFPRFVSEDGFVPSPEVEYRVFYDPTDESFAPPVWRRDPSDEE